MRLLKLHIDGEYKNLKDFTIEFTGDNLIEVFVGKNGTGKSNLFEAIIEILRNLYDREYLVYFGFEIEYELDGTRHHFQIKKGRLLHNGNEIEKVQRNLLPDNIIIYYSGHNNKINEVVSQYEETFRKKIKGAELSHARDFIGIGKDYKSLLIAVILLQEETNLARKYIMAKLGIKNLSHEFRLNLKRPDYAAGRAEYNVDPFEPATSYWKVKGIVSDFLSILEKVKQSEDHGRVRTTGYIPKENDDDEYILFYDVEDFKIKTTGTNPQDLFRNLDNLKTLGMLKEISLEVQLLNGTKIDINHFSDGQFQTIYIYSIIELFKDRNCLMLLDEPDAFLHPEWQYDFLKQVLEINENRLQNNHILLSSHSAITLLQSEDKKVNFFRLEGNNLQLHKVSKTYAISQLSSRLINLQVDKQILSIIHTLGQSKPILFTEGYSDPIILTNAYHVLYDEMEIPFEICFGHGCKYLRLLLQNEKFLKEMDGRPIFGLFDYDEAYNEWNSIPTNKEYLEVDVFRGCAKQYLDWNSYALLLPVPNIVALLPQVMKSSGGTFEHNSKIEIEHLFYSESTKEHFHLTETTGGAKILEIGDSKKMKFATEVVPTLPPDAFEILRPMFDFIKSKI